MFATSSTSCSSSAGSSGHSSCTADACTERFNAAKYDLNTHLVVVLGEATSTLFSPSAHTLLAPHAVRLQQPPLQQQPQQQQRCSATAAGDAAATGSCIYDRPQLYDDAFSYRDFVAEVRHLLGHTCTVARLAAAQQPKQLSAGHLVLLSCQLLCRSQHRQHALL